MSTYLNINAIKDGSIPNSKLEENYVVQEEGKQLSTNDFTDTLKSKLESLYNYDDTDIQNSIQLLSDKLEILFGESGTDAIETFNEIIKFLENIDDSESLDSIIKSIEQQITQKQDVISDLSTIRSNASKGAVAEQNAKNYTNFEIDKLTPSVIVNDNTIAVQVGAKQSEEVIVPYAKFANDLTGRIEATPEEFTFRPSAGDKSIRDESAFIKRIKGNTIVYNQLAYNGDFGLGTNNWESSIPSNTKSIENGNFVITVETEAAAGNILQSRTIKRGVYAICAKWRVISEGYEAVMASGFFSTPTMFFPRIAVKHNEWIVQNMIITATQDYAMFSVGPYFYAASVGSVKLPAGAKIEYEHVNVVNLTQMFGAGNEPTTVEEFKALFPDSYYPYCESELRSVTTKAIETVGFNQFNGEYAEVLPNQTYYLGGTYTTIGFTEELGGTTEEITIADDKLYTPTKKGYIYATGTDICINLSHSGVRNGEYQPYEKHTKDLSIIQKYFPDGMRSAGSVYDEIRYNDATEQWEAVQRVGAVDLGSSNIIYDSRRNAFYTRLYDSKVLGGALCPKFTLSNVSAISLVDGEMSLHNTYYDHSVIFKATSYTDATTFKASLQGVMLYYELAEPIITPIEETVDLSYKVGDFGIEKMLSDSFSAPFKADIIYKFNATDRIRENSMNISKLSKQHTLLESEFNTRLSDVARLEDGKLPIDNLHAPMLIFEVIWNMDNNDVPLKYSTQRAVEVVKAMYAMQENARSSIDTTVMLVMSSPDTDIVYRVPLSYFNGSWWGVIPVRFGTYESEMLGREVVTTTNFDCVEITLRKDKSGMIAMASKVARMSVENLTYSTEMQGPVYAKKEQFFTEEEKAQARQNIGAADENKSLSLTVLDNGNIRLSNPAGESRDFMPATPSGSPQHDLYEAMGAKWNATTGYWELNGINDLTNADMAKVPDMRTNLIFTNGQYALANFRTNVWAKYLYTPIKTILANVFRNNTALEVLILNSVSSLYDVESTGQIAAFYGCSKLRVINGKIKLAWLTANMFDRCTMLEEVRLSALNDNIRFDASPKLSKQSLLYLIENAAPTTAITITVHADVYAWASTDAEVQAALAAQPLVTLISV